MKNKTEPQNKRIIDYLKRGFSLTKLQALRQFGCINLGARIHEYRKDYPIVTRMIKVPSGKWVARYRLIKVGSIVIYHGEFYKVTKKRVGCCMESISIVSGIVHIRKKKYASSKRVHIDDLS